VVGPSSVLPADRVYIQPALTANVLLLTTLY
jgi:hypothetical protein